EVLARVAQLVLVPGEPRLIGVALAGGGAEHRRLEVRARIDAPQLVAHQSKDGGLAARELGEGGSAEGGDEEIERGDVAQPGPRVELVRASRRGLLAEGVPVPAEPVVADLPEQVHGLVPVPDVHAAAHEQLDLLVVGAELLDPFVQAHRPERMRTGPGPTEVGGTGLGASTLARRENGLQSQAACGAPRRAHQRPVPRRPGARTSPSGPRDVTRVWPRPFASRVPFVCCRGCAWMPLEVLRCDQTSSTGTVNVQVRALG